MLAVGDEVCGVEAWGGEGGLLSRGSDDAG